MTYQIKHINLLIRAGADINQAEEVFGRAPIFWARNASIFSLLVDAGININSKDYDGKTPLIRATQANYIEATHKLLKAKADIFVIDNNEQNAIDYALKYENYEIAKIILDQIVADYGEKAFSMMSFDKDNNTLLHLAVKCRYQELIFKILTFDARLMHIKNNNGEVPVFFALSDTERLLPIFTFVKDN